MDGFTYVLTIISEALTKSDVEHALSTMVPVEDR
jgi:hypothetical protein